MLAPEHVGSVAVARRLSCPSACGILAPPGGIKPASPALEGRFLTTGPPGKSLSNLICSFQQHREKDTISVTILKWQAVWKCLWTGKHFIWMSYCLTHEETKGGMWFAQDHTVKGNARAQTKNSQLKSSTSPSALVLTWANYLWTEKSCFMDAVLWILTHLAISKTFAMEN